jgi:hypothetical protein
MLGGKLPGEEVSPSYSAKSVWPQYLQLECPEASWEEERSQSLCGGVERMLQTFRYEAIDARMRGVFRNLE